ncbi:MAG: prepilin-type N-terminal cleavage/methylation domain-containing protein, partial [Moraxellaceae bacterium]
MNKLINTKPDVNAQHGEITRNSKFKRSAQQGFTLIEVM